MGRRQLCRIESFARGRQVTAWFGIIDCRQSRLAKSRRILHDFVAFTVALVILICRRVQWFETRVRPAKFQLWGRYIPQAAVHLPSVADHHRLYMPRAFLPRCRSRATAYALRTSYTLFDNIFLWVWIDITIPNPAISTISADPP
ncbi:Uncharacterised protein [Escherichia coli]|uniref:Uncharacterized protein n=1 Tax=Escherichia coli TaxID=562 RepID=A0A2X1KJP2_ECOLX|nr:Uncharacterised protein [Escherichia coli]